MPLIINTQGKLVTVTYTSEERLLVALKALSSGHEKKNGMEAIAPDKKKGK